MHVARLHARDAAKVDRWSDRLSREYEAQPGLVIKACGIPKTALLALIKKGLTREAAYRLVQRNAMQTWQAKHAGQNADFKAQLLSDPAVKKHFKAGELEKLCSLDFHFQNGREKFKKVFGKAVKVLRRLAPLLGLHLLFRNFEFFEHEIFRRLRPRRSGRRRRNTVLGKSVTWLRDPSRRSLMRPRRPVQGCSGVQTRAGDVEFEIRIFGLELAKFVVEDGRQWSCETL